MHISARSSCVLALGFLFTLACAANTARDGGPDGEGPPIDAARTDGGPIVVPMDSGPPDAGPRDAGPGSGGTCEPCEDHGDCQSGFFCVPLTVGGRTCLPSCIPDLPSCPRAFSCVDIVASGHSPVCAPTGGPCCVDEDADEYGQGSGCAGPDCDDDDFMVHPGAPELCNGRDDDCDGTADEPPTDCASGRCEPVGDGTYQAVEGAECSAVGACTSGEVVPCGDFVCDGDVCATTCLDASGAPDHARCIASAYCDDAGLCQPRVPDGSTCGGDAECASGHCDNGYCCSGGTCCATVADCPPSTAPVCNDPATCQGARGDATCESFRCVVHSGIDDDSACSPTTVASACGLFQPVYCNGEADQTAPTCPTTCAADADCVPGAHCNGGVCAPDRPPGDTCSRDGQCRDELRCVSGVCCMSASCDDGSACTMDLCTGGTCSNPAICAGTTTSCGCSSCMNCTTLDGWVNLGSAYACCDGGQRCTCQDQEYRTHTCSGSSCVFSVTDTRVMRSGCATCNDGNACTADACVDGACTASGICAGTATSCGCTSCTDCSASTGWYDVGAPYACCDGAADRCTCQNQELRTFTCAGTSCISSITDTRVVRSGCAACDDGDPCTTDSCSAGTCSSAAICAGTTASCGCTSCTSCTGGMVCASGACQCPSGQTNCSGTCRNLQTDATSCGACGRACPPGATCSGGQCHYGTQSCPTGQFAIGFSTSGVIQCSTINAIALEAVHARCRIYTGSRDNCSGCTTAPDRWGYTTQSGCMNGTGTGNTCTIHTLGGADVRMFGLNPTGDVDDNDKFYYGLHCTNATAATTTTTGMCPAGSFITSLNSNGSFVCTRAEPAMVDYVRNECRLYAGWIDRCEGCTSLPTRYGWVSHSGCSNLSGGTNNCSTYNLNGTSVRMFGLNTGGDVDGNDQFRIGFYCNSIAEAPVSASACPSSQLATGVNGGAVTCVAAQARADDYVRSSCSAYYGWQDRCGTCSSVPSKWGRVSSLSCTNGEGTHNSCVTHNLGGTTLPMFGLNTDGNVDGNDKFYAGLRCL